MREILFRAKRKDNGEWIEGYYAKVKHYLTEETTHVIFSTDTTLYPHSEFSEYEEIVPETLGRLINGPCYDGVWDGERRFFEGDIIGVYRSKHCDFNNEPDSLAIVVDEHSITENGLGRWFPQDTIITKVLGNVWDNPELVGKKYADLYKYYHGYETTIARDDLKKNTGR